MLKFEGHQDWVKSVAFSPPTFGSLTRALRKPADPLSAAQGAAHHSPEPYTSLVQNESLPSFGIVASP